MQNFKPKRLFPFLRQTERNFDDYNLMEFDAVYLKERIDNMNNITALSTISGKKKSIISLSADKIFRLGSNKLNLFTLCFHSDFSVCAHLFT
jgi:hypothetical protein